VAENIAKCGLKDNVDIFLKQFRYIIPRRENSQVALRLPGVVKGGKEVQKLDGGELRHDLLNWMKERLGLSKLKSLLPYAFSCF
jgi:hypothetical protein